MKVIDVYEALLPQILAIETRCFSLPWTESALRSQLLPGHVFLAAVEERETGTEVLGYVGLAYVLDEGYISNVAVAPEHRRRHVSDALLNALEARGNALGLAFLTLEVRESNAPAAALYAKHGYREAGRRRNYYEKPREDALLLTRRLDG